MNGCPLAKTFQENQSYSKRLLPVFSAFREEVVDTIAIDNSYHSFPVP